MVVQHLASRAATASSMRPSAAGGGMNSLVRGHGQHVGHPALDQRPAQRRDLAVGLVAGHPRRGYPRVQGAGQHRLGQLGLGGEPDRVVDAGLAAAFPVLGPGFRQVELAVEQGAPGRGGVGQEHPDLAVLDPPRGPGVLPLHPGGLAAFLQEPGVVDDQHTAGVAELRGDPGTQVVAQQVGIPVRAGQQPLHRVRRPRPGGLGDRPAVLAFQRRQQRPDIADRAGPRLTPPEPRP